MLALSNTHRIYGNLDVAAGATADLSQASGVYLNDLTGDSGSTLELGTGALMIAEVLNRILAGTIEDGGNGAGILQKRGNRSLRLSGHNTCSGGTQIQVGLVDLAYADSAGTGEIDFIGSGSLTVE
ncbi:hypothetical protein MOV66_16210 [Agrobacterium sp. SHOUNA12C]|jgi:hypothetical protein|nr:hypothetical protein [Agrobacterium sp. BETTINA12B]MCJ9758195.1 hypothetical protein [Agrobacterium sp. SHOUNA12C]